MAALATELRLARLAAGLTQSVVAEAAGISRAELSRIERQESPWLDIVAASELCAVLGLDLWLRAYAGGDAVRDAAHVELLNRFLSCVSRPLVVRTEVPLDRAGDPRSWDALVSDRASHVGVEAETRMTDAQALERRVALKRRDGGVDRVIMVIADTRANRSAVRFARSRLRADYPLDTAELIASVSHGRLPGAGGIALI